MSKAGESPVPESQAPAPLWCYEKEPYRRQLDTRVHEVASGEGGVELVLEDTILYPEGGGQPSDRGTIAGSPVVDTQKREGVIVHLLGSTSRVFSPADAVEVELDWERRFDHMQQHTAQHLLSAIADDVFGWPTTSFHLNVFSSPLSRCDVELAVESLSTSQLDGLEQRVNECIRSSLPVRTRRIPREEVEGLDVRSRGLPSGHSGSVRLVEIEGIDLNTCGGTHVASTSQIESVKLLGCESMRGGTRLYFVAGSRVRARLEAQERRLAGLRALFETSDADLIEVAGAKLRDLSDKSRELRSLESELAETSAALLARKAPGASLLEAHYEGRSAAFLGEVGRALRSGLEGPGHAFLTATQGDRNFFLLITLDEAAQLEGLGERLAEVLEGRGGGRGGQFQGVFESFGRREAAIRLLRTIDA